MSKRKQNLAMKLPLYGMWYGEYGVQLVYVYFMCACVCPRARQKRRVNGIRAVMAQKALLRKGEYDGNRSASHTSRSPTADGPKDTI